MNRLGRDSLAYCLPWVMAALLWTLVPHFTRQGAWLVALALLVVGSRLAVTYRGWRPVPGPLRLLLTIGAFAAVLYTNGHIIGRGAGAALLSVMLILKSLESYRTRDLYVIAGLCYFMTVVNFLFSQSPPHVIHAASSFILVTAALTAIHRPAERPLGLRVGLTGGALSLAWALPLAVAMFLLFPRLAAPLWGMPENALDGKTGVGEEMRPGSIAELFLDDSPAFRVRFDGEPPPVDQRYWRGPVLWNYEGNTWSVNEWFTRGRRLKIPDAQSLVSYQITLEAHQRRWLFAMDYPVEIDYGYVNLDGSSRASRSVIDLRRYRAVSDPSLGSRQKLLPRAREMALQLPPAGNPRTRELARSWREAGLTDGQIVRRALALFNQQPFEYSLRAPPLAGDAMDDFLFNTLRGYCEHYSSAFTVLMRAAGVPARVVTGYQGGYYNAAADYLLIRQSDAHAWSEVWLSGSGWVRVDPTAAVAPERIDRGATSALQGAGGWAGTGWWRGVRNRLDVVNRFWNDWVLAFDQARQRSLLSALGVERPSAGKTATLMTAAVAALLTLMVWLILRPRTERSPDVARRWFDRFSARLARRGLARAPAEDEMRFARRAASALPACADEIRSIAALYDEVRYRARPSAGALEEFVQRVRRFRIPRTVS